MAYTVEDIAAKALDLGYESCGIIPIAEMAGYADKLRERIERLPDNEAKYAPFFRFAQPQKDYPWAKSIVICVRPYGKYVMPQHLAGVIGKYYLFDGRVTNTPGYLDSVAFETYLASLGLKVEGERRFGITALRWAAAKANLGLMRRNNFFYTVNGSWCYLEAWLIDAPLELRGNDTSPPCPQGCRRCLDACPTRSLVAPYTMSRLSCISNLTTWDGDDMLNNPYREQMGQWIFGCDACQDACPYNTGKWQEQEDFPGLAQLAEQLSLPQILLMDYDYLAKVVQPKFWYISCERLYKWKLNVLTAMHNAYQPAYYDSIKAATRDENEQVREMAHWLLKQIDGVAQADSNT